MGDVFSNTFVVAQICGLLAFLIQAAAWQLKKPRVIIFLHVPINVLWTIQFYLLGAFVGCFQSIACGVKEFFLSTARAKYVPYIIFSYIMASFIVVINFFGVWYDVLPFVGTFIVNIAMLQRDNRALIARASIACALCWLVYNLNTAAYVTMTCDCFFIIAVMVGMARHENWQLGRCYRTFFPSLARSLFPSLRTYP